MAIENPNLPQSTTPISNSTPIQTNPQNQHRSRPRVREVSSRFMSPVTRTPSFTPKQPPSTPFESHISKTHSLRRSNTDFRPPQSKYDGENRPYHFNRTSVSPVRRAPSSKPRAAVKLFKDGLRPDTPVPVTGPRLVRQRSFDTAASKLLKASGISCDDESDCVSVKSEPIDCSENNDCSGRSGGVSVDRVLTPCSRSIELMGGGLNLNSFKGGGGGGNMSKVAQSLNLPPMPPGGCLRPQGMVDGKKMVLRKGGPSQGDDVMRLKLLYNHYLQWRFVNAKAKACLNDLKINNERQLYSMVVKISELQDSVKNKRIEVGHLKEAQALSKVLETQMPCLSEWSSLEEAYSSSLLELVQGLQNVSSRLPLIGNVKADAKELNEAMNSALMLAESICLQVQRFVPKAEQMDSLISDLARVHNGELSLVQECGDLLSKTHLSQIEECSLRGQLMQSTNANFMFIKDQTQH